MNNKSSAMLSPQMDVLFIGGAAIILFLLAHYAIAIDASTYTVSWFTFYLSFIINYPHFLASYQLLYVDYKHRLREPKFIWAAFIAPALIIGYIIFAIATYNAEMMGYLVKSMFVLVGWHYVKQIYGTTIVSAAANLFFMTQWEKRVLYFNLISLWVLSWVCVQGGATHNYLGIPYSVFDLPNWTRILAYTFTFISLAAVFLLVLNKYVKEGTLPPLASSCCFASIYIWYIPTWYHPIYFYIIPFFHSLQYMLFVFTLKKNKVEYENKNLRGEEYRKQFLRSYWGFMLGSVILGAAGFQWIPKMLDNNFDFSDVGLGSSIFLFSFHVFINIHHYFIDNVIWTKDNKDLSDFIIKPSQKAAQPQTLQVAS